MAKTEKANARYFIGYKTGKTKIRPLCIKLPWMTGSFVKTGKSQKMSFVIKNMKKLGKYESIWNGIRNTIGKKN